MSNGASGAGGVAGAVLSFGGSVLDYKSNKEAAKQREKQIEQLRKDILDRGRRATDALQPSYNAAQDVRQQGLDANLALTGNTFEPRVDLLQDSGYMAQQAVLAGLMGQRAATLGDPINYGALQPQSVPVDMSALTGITNPTGINFTPMATPDYGDTAQETFTAGDVSQYLANYPDLTKYYEENKETLIDGSGNDIFNSLEGYAKWHYDNFGKAEGRIYDRPLPNMVAAQGALTTNIDTSMDGFTGDQVRGAMMGVVT